MRDPDRLRLLRELLARVERNREQPRGPKALEAAAEAMLLPSGRPSKSRSAPPVAAQERWDEFWESPSESLPPSAPPSDRFEGAEAPPLPIRLSRPPLAAPAPDMEPARTLALDDPEDFESDRPFPAPAPLPSARAWQDTPHRAASQAFDVPAFDAMADLGAKESRRPSRIPLRIRGNRRRHLIAKAREPRPRKVLGLTAAAVVLGAFGLGHLLRGEDPRVEAAPSAATPSSSDAPANASSAGLKTPEAGSARPTRPEEPKPASAVPEEPHLLPTSSAPPPANSELNEELGAVLVETLMPRDIYANGVSLGKSGTWLTLPCGWKNVRTARPGPPPAGASYPVWRSEGVPVLVPCGTSARVRLLSDP